MAANRKLTPLLAERVVQSEDMDSFLWRIVFTDGSVLTLKLGTQGPFPYILQRTVKKVRQTGPLMKLDFADGTTVEIGLAEATSSAMLRNSLGVLEYVD